MEALTVTVHHEELGDPGPAFGTLDTMSLTMSFMSDMKLTVGGAMEEDASCKFIDAWHRGERGERFHERHLAFESWEALARVLTGKRMELLRSVRRNNVPSAETV
jgi:predicted transcriptional regulator